MVDCSSIDKPLSVLYTFSVYWLWLSNSHQAIHAKGVEGHHLSPFLLLCRSLSMIFLWMENSLRRRMACWLGFHRSSRYGRIVAQPIPRPYKRYWWLPVCWTPFHRVSLPPEPNQWIAEDLHRLFHTYETVFWGLTPANPHMKWNLAPHVLRLFYLWIQEICSSCADHVQFACWLSATAPVTGQAGAGTAKLWKENPTQTLNNMTTSSPTNCVGVMAKVQPPCILWLLAIWRL